LKKSTELDPKSKVEPITPAKEPTPAKTEKKPEPEP